MKFLLMGLVGLISLPILAIFVAHPSRTLLPLYAGTLPIASVISLSLPLPPPFNTLSSLLGALMIVAGLTHVIIYRRGRIPSVPVAIWLLFLGWATLTSFWAIKVADATSTILVAVPLLLLMVVVALLEVDEEDFDVLRVALIAGSALVGMWAAYLLLSGRALPAHGVSERFSVTSNPDTTNPNILAVSLLLPLALAVHMMVFGGKRWWSERTWRLIGIWGSVFTVIAIVLTSSRGGMMAAAAVFVICLLYCARDPRDRSRTVRTAGGILVATMAIGVFIVVSLAISPSGGFVRRILSSGPFERIAQRQTDSSGRLEIWTAGLLACETYCEKGAGFGNFENAYAQVYALSAASENVGASRPAHNVYLGMVVETGFLGLSLLGLALASEWYLVSSRQMRKFEPALKAGIIGLLIASIFLSAIWFKYFWLVFALIRAAESATDPQAAIRRSSPPLVPAISASAYRA
ncbi:MAG TPA: O-antigen ligase family protein [Actinomycetota bacterium]|nr:O-antigen ligase family protein [Actinomycetota bacterium]